MYRNFSFNEQVSFDNISLYLNNESILSNFKDLPDEEKENDPLINSNGNFLKMSQEKNINDLQRDSNSQFDSFKDDDQQQSMEVQENKRMMKKPKIYCKKKLAKMNKFHAKKYREKKKQKFKLLEEQNIFLKSKVDDLTFRLKQAQLEISKFKHSSQSPNFPNLQSTRESLLKQIAEIMKSENKQIDKLMQLQEQLKKINTFNGKHKIDFLNYFMNELLENLLNDRHFYFIDSLVEEKGRWKVGWSEDRRIDEELCEIMGISDFQCIKKLLNSIPSFNIDHLRNLKNMWKKLYQDYLNIVNQGNFIESLCLSLFERNNNEKYQRRIMGSLKLQLYFQRIKYRKDMRQLRQSWFHGLKFQSQISNFKKQVIAKN